METVDARPLGSDPSAGTDTGAGAAAPAPDRSPAPPSYGVDLAAALRRVAASRPDATFLEDPAAGAAIRYDEAADRVAHLVRTLETWGIGPLDRVVVAGSKSIDQVLTLIALTGAGALAVPVNPASKVEQVRHILRDCAPRLVIAAGRHGRIAADASARLATPVPVVASLAETAPRLIGDDRQRGPASSCDDDPAVIFYTSGSTGRPKGVVFSHRNVMAGAEAVNGYLGTTGEDAVLALLPLSFDAGFSQITTGLLVGARIVLHDYLSPHGAVRTCAEHAVTMLTALPPIWRALAPLDWPPAAAEAMRVFANTGGHMSEPLLAALRRRLPRAQPYLMYGFTEAFRASFLDPAEIDRRPGSIGKAIPNAHLLVVDPDGRECPPGQAGELVQRGATVALGYWNAPEATASKFRPCPAAGHAIPGLAPVRTVYSGDTVVRDEDGFLYFVGRSDEMIKSRGVRVSPTEIEEIVYASGLVDEAVAFGLPAGDDGDEICVAVARADGPVDLEALQVQARAAMPAYMLPGRWIVEDALPKLPNGKLDRAAARTAAVRSAAAVRPAPADMPGPRDTPDRRRLVVIETVAAARLFTTTARDLGLDPVLVAALPQSIPNLDGIEIEILRGNCQDVEAMVRLVETVSARAPVAGLCSGSDVGMECVATLAERFGLPGPDADRVRRFRDKANQRRALAEAGVDDLPHAVVGPGDDVETAVAAVGLPAVVKPVKGTGSIGVRVCDTLAEVVGHVRQTLPRSKVLYDVDRFLIERRIVGRQLGVDVLGGRPVGITEKLYDGAIPLSARAHEYPATLTPGQTATVAAFVEGLVAATGLDRGALHVELRLTAQDRVHLVEINQRVPSNMIELQRAVSGRNLVEDVIREQAGLPAKAAPPAPTRFGVLSYIVPGRTGTLAAVEGLEAARAVPGCAGVSIYYSVGRVVGRHADNRSRLGHVICTGDTIDTARARLAEALAALRLRID